MDELTSSVERITTYYNPEGSHTSTSSVRGAPSMSLSRYGLVTSSATCRNWPLVNVCACADTETTIRSGAKVMQTRNNYDKNIDNGDIGFIEQSILSISTSAPLPLERS
jgi:hypothetical protein